MIPIFDAILRHLIETQDQRCQSSSCTYSRLESSVTNQSDTQNERDSFASVKIMDGGIRKPDVSKGMDCVKGFLASASKW